MENLKYVLERTGEGYELETHELYSNEDAVRWKVAGLPAIHVNGKDVEMSVRKIQDYSVKCRTYKEGEKNFNTSSKTMLLRAINELLPDPVICYCKGVRRSLISDALKNGAKTFKDVQKMTGASTGNECELKNPTGKCCSPFVVEIIKGWQGSASVSFTECCKK